MSGQSKWMSFWEATSGTVAGFALAVATNWFVLPLFGFEATLDQAFGITAIFAVISTGRIYVWRRAFNWWQERKA
jgi:hypothetical protein